MSARNPEAAGSGSAMDRIVADYLRGHPDFFARHGEVLAGLELPHPCGRAVSLIEYQVEVLRDQNRTLRQRLEDLLATARENEQLSGRVHRLTLALVRCSGLAEVLETLYGALRESFGADYAAVRLFADPVTPDLGRLPEFLGDDEGRRRALAPTLGVPEALCGRLPPDQVSALFGEQGAGVRSGAVLPLGIGSRVGVLAIGSGDEGRYRPGMGTTFLRQLADVASEVMLPYVRQA